MTTKATKITKGHWFIESWVVATQICFMFIPTSIWGNDSQFDEHIFQNGLKPPEIIFSFYLCYPFSHNHGSAENEPIVEETSREPFSTSIMGGRVRGLFDMIPT